MRYVWVAICLFALNAVVMAETNKSTLPFSQETRPDAELTSSSWGEYAKDVAQILFWIAIGTVSILTYHSAKKTILQPIRTEIFKVQLEEMRRILALFVGKGEWELRSAYALDKVFTVNAFMMYDAYASNFFDVEVDRDKRPYGTSECSISVITKEGAMKHFKFADDYIQANRENSKKIEKDQRVRAALWADYEQYEISVPKEFAEQEQRIRDLLENPLLPTECGRLLTDYRDAVHENLEQLRKLLTECAKEMPEKYPSLEALSASSFDWIRHRFSQKSVSLKPKAESIVSFVRSRYDVDNLLTT